MYFPGVGTFQGVFSRERGCFPGGGHFFGGIFYGGIFLGGLFSMGVFSRGFLQTKFSEGDIQGEFPRER